MDDKSQSVSGTRSTGESKIVLSDIE